MVLAVAAVGFALSVTGCSDDSAKNDKKLADPNQVMKPQGTDTKQDPKKGGTIPPNPQ